MAMGKQEAKKIVEPYIKYRLAGLYAQGKSPVEGAAAVARFIRKQENVELFKKYGIDPSDIYKAARELGESGASGVKLAAQEVRRETVSRTLKIQDPYKVPTYILGDANPASTYHKILAVSKDASWKGNIDGLIKDHLKKQIDSGVDIFADKKIAEVLPVIYSKPQLKALQDYHTLAKSLKPAPPRTTVSLTEGEFEAATGEFALQSALSATSLPLRVYFALKQLLHLEAKSMRGAYEREFLQYIDEGLTDPAQAKVIIEAFKGSKYGKAKLAKEIKGRMLAAERVAPTALKKIGVPTLRGEAAPAARTSSGVKLFDTGVEMEVNRENRERRGY
jgi:hypothetical protein